MHFAVLSATGRLCLKAPDNVKANVKAADKKIASLQVTA
jgi:hypothetical protein